MSEVFSGRWLPAGMVPSQGLCAQLGLSQWERALLAVQSIGHGEHGLRTPSNISALLSLVGLRMLLPGVEMCGLGEVFPGELSDGVLWGICFLCIVFFVYMSVFFGSKKGVK